MKRTSKLLLAALLVLPLLVVASPVRADENMETTPTTTEQTKPRTGNEGLTLKERLDKRKAEIKTKLTNVEKQRVQTRCKAAQGKVSSLKGRITGIETSRTNVHTNLVNHLKSLSEKLKAQNINTSTLDAQITELETKIATWGTDLAKYEEAVDDLANMDCAADPDAFKASLEAARAQRVKLAEDGKAIHDYLKNTIKPTLASIRQQLESEEN